MGTGHNDPSNRHLLCASTAFANVTWFFQWKKTTNAEESLITVLDKLLCSLGYRIAPSAEDQGTLKRTEEPYSCMSRCQPKAAVCPQPAEWMPAGLTVNVPHARKSSRAQWEKESRNPRGPTARISLWNEGISWGGTARVWGKEKKIQQKAESWGKACLRSASLWDGVSYEAENSK